MLPTHSLESGKVCIEMKKGLTGLVISLLLILSIVFGVLYVCGNNRHISQVRNLLDSVDERDTQLFEMSNELSNKTKQIQDLNKQLSDRTSLIIQLQSKIETESESVSSLENDLADKNARIETLTSENSQQAKQISAQTQSIKDLDSGIADLNDQILQKTDLISELNTGIEEKNSQIDALTASSEQKSLIINSLNASIEDINGQLLEMKNELEQKNLLISKLNDDLEEKSNELAQFHVQSESDINPDRIPSEELPDIFSASSSSDTEGSDTDDSIEKQIALLNSKLTEKDNQIELLNAAIANLEGQNEALKADIVKRAGLNASLSSELSEKETELETIKTQLSSLQSSQENFEQQKQFMKQWFIYSIASDFTGDQSDQAEGVTMQFKIRSSDNPNVRSEPGTAGKIIGHAAASSEYTVLDISPGLWFKIRLENGKTGWISSKMGILSELRFPFESESTTP